MSEIDSDAQKANESFGYNCTTSKRIDEDTANDKAQNFATSDLQPCQHEFKCSNMNCCSTLADIDDDDEDEDLSDAPNGDSIELWECEKRHSGDGEEYPETTVESKLDDDEDKTNPAYIPRKGSFFEHDLRNDCRDSETDFKLKKRNRIDGTKWQHDKFDEKFQAPKSRQEIMAVYGFDIREDCMPIDISKKSNKHRIGKKAQPADAFREWLRTDKPRNDYSEKTFCPRRSWPDVTFRIQQELMKQPSHTIAKSTIDVTFTNYKERNESYLNPEIEYLNKDSAVKDNDLPISKKNHVEVIKDSRKSVKIGTGRILCENLERIQTNSSRSSDKQLLGHSRQISGGTAERKRNIIYPPNHKTKYIGHVCEDRSIQNDLPTSAAAVSQSTHKSQDVRLLERKELLLHGYDLHTKVSCGSKRSTVIIQTTMTPEIIPPVTCIRTNSKSAEVKSITASRSNNTAHATLVNGNGFEESCIWSGREFVPSESKSSKSDIKTKRYSSQRLKITSPGSDLPETESRDEDCGDNDIALVPNMASMNASVISGPYQSTAYYGALSAPQNMLHFPKSAVLPFAVPSFNYTLPVNSGVLPNQLRVYNSPDIKSKTMSVVSCATPLMHGAYVNSQTLMTGTYVNSPVFNYGGTLTQRYSFATVENHSGHPARRKGNEGGNPLEVRGGTVYFNPEIQQIDLLHGTTYFNTEEQAQRLKSPVRRPKAAIPIVKPKDLAEKETINTLNDYKVMQQHIRNTDVTLPTERTGGENGGDDNATLHFEETDAKEENENEAKQAK